MLLISLGVFALPGFGETPTNEQQAAVLIPASAAVWRSSQAYAFVVVDGKAQRRPLELGIGDRDQWEVISGVRPGELVVSPAADGLVDGDPVTLDQGGRR